MSRRTLIVIVAFIVILCGVILYPYADFVARKNKYINVCKQNGQSSEFCQCTWNSMEKSMTNDEKHHLGEIPVTRIMQLTTSAGFECLNLIKVDINQQ